MLRRFFLRSIIILCPELFLEHQEVENSSYSLWKQFNLVPIESPRSISDPQKKRSSRSETLKKLNEFILTHQRLPSSESYDMQESLLGLWLKSFQKRNLQRTEEGPLWSLFLDSEVRILLKELNLLERPRRFNQEERLVQLNEFLELHGRLPSSKKPPGEEKSLGLWFVKFKKERPRWYEFLDPHNQEFIIQKYFQGDP
jgi:hypothetical protein